jgi:hypothetical protein
MALVCKIELSQTAGVTVTVVNSEGNITQTAKFDGTTITHTCQGRDATSTITQTPDSITVTCKKFTVDAESITCKSTQDTLHEAQGKYSVNSTDTAAFNSSADLNVSATSKLNMKAADFSAAAQDTARVTALTTTINGDQKANITGLQLALSAQTDASLKGATVKTAAQTTMEIDGLTTTVKGQVVGIQGSLVKLG